MFDDRGRSFLTAAGTASAVLAVLHVVVIIAGPPAYRFVGAPDEFATLAEAGSRAPDVLTAGFAVIFALWSVYAFGGARLMRRPPLVRLGLVLIAAVYVLRGLSAIPEAILLLRTPYAFPPRFLVFSLISLVIGLFHALGVRQAWRRLSPRFRP